MSYFQDVLVNCPTIQADLVDRWQTGISVACAEKMPVAEFLTSSSNRRGIVQDILPGRGKVRNVELRYWPRLLESSVQNNQSNPNCTNSTTIAGDLSTTRTLDTSINIQTTPEGFNATDLQNICRDNGTFFSELMERHMDVLERRAATLITTQAAALYGKWGDGIFTTGNVNASDEFVIPTLTSAGGPAPYSWTELRNGLEDIGYCSGAFIGSGRILRNYMQYTNAGCCTDQGIDIGEIANEHGYAVAYDYRLATALASQNKALAIMPGALQVLWYTRTPWKEGIPSQWLTGANYADAVMVSPRLGIPADVNVTDVCGNITIKMTMTIKVIGMPTDMFATGDRLAGITGVNKILVTNP